MIRQVFLSHATDADAATATRIATDLRAAGVQVWMAPGSIAPGGSFSAEIDRGLENSDWFVVLLSPASLASRWVQTEVYAALDLAQKGRMSIIPARLSPVGVPPLLATFQQIDLTDYDRGLLALGEALGVSLQPRSAPPPERAPSPVQRSLRTPPDEFVATALASLEMGARPFGYLVHRPPPSAASILDAVVEVALLRIGIAVSRSADVSTGRVLANIERELRTNPHQVAAILWIAEGRSTGLKPQRLLDEPTPNAMLLTWNPADGSDALGAAVPLLVELMTGRATPGK
jgi:hypothetical protein